MADSGQPHRSNNDDADVMLLVRYLNGATLNCSVISTQNNSFKVLDDGNFSSLPFLKEDNFDPTVTPPCVDVYATCNSWILYSTNFSDIPFDALWNPTTGENATLPFFAFCSPRLSFPWVYGLGYDPAGDTYKVLRCRVMLASDNETRELYVELLSLSAAASDLCKQIHCPHDFSEIQLYEKPSLYINGFCYWATDVGSFVSFDFAEERFGPLIPKPKSNVSFHPLYGTVYPVEYDASLAAVVFDEGVWLRNNKDPAAAAAAETKPFVFEIWVWKEAKWSFVFTGKILASDAYVDRVLGLYKNQKLFLSGSYGDLLVYDLESRKLVNLGIRDESPGMMEVFPYVANAESSFKSSSRNLWPGDTTTSVDGFPATIRALTRSLKPDDSLMLMVQCIVDWTRIFFVISTENNSFKVLLQGDDNHLPDLSRLKAEKYDLDCKNAKYHVEASCNTWMLWSCTVNPARSGLLLLWDPRTDVFITLPSFEPEPRVPGPTTITSWGFGIGFDPSAPGDYKVVRCRMLEYFNSDNDTYAEVFSLGTWNQIPYPHDLVWDVYQYPSLFINGFYYWMAKHSTTNEVGIISFDFAKEEFPPALIPMPGSKILRDIMCVSLAEFHGSLAAIVYNYHGHEKKSMSIGYPRRDFGATHHMTAQRKRKNHSAPFACEIWVWKHSCWSHVSTYEVPTPVVFLRVIGLYKNDKVFLQDLQGYLWLYDHETLKLENLKIRDDSLTLTVFPYV